MKLDFKYYLSVFWRRFPYFIVIASIFTSVGLTMAVILPAEYEADATLLVEDAAIPDDLAASTVQTRAQEQLQIIEQRLMTRANLLDVADRLNVYAAERAAGEAPTAAEIVADMRERTTFRRRSGREAATLLDISFKAPNAAQSAEVANEFVTLVLKENVEFRTNRAGDTLAFFEQEVERLGSELDVRGSRILEFKNQNANALPDGLAYLRDRQLSLQERLNRIDRDRTSLTDQRTRIVEIFERTGQLSENDAPRTPEEEALRRAQRELDDALLIYAPGNPRIRLLEARVEQQRQRVADSLGNEPEIDPGKALMETQLADIDGEIEVLDEEEERLIQELETVEGYIVQVPANAITLESLQRDYQNIQSQYNSAVNRLSRAATGERIELLSKGQKITVIEQATPPASPTSPNRPIIAGAGAAAGLGLGLGLILLMEILNRSIRRPVELSDKLGIAPLAVLPYIRTERELALRRLVIFGVIAVLLIVIPVLLFLVHSFLLPLDVMLERQLNKAGFSIISE